jgi:hypothetical protein
MAALNQEAIRFSRGVVQNALHTLAAADIDANILAVIGDLSSAFPHDGFGVTIDQDGQCDSVTLFISSAAGFPIQGMQRKLSKDYDGQAAYQLAAAIASEVDILSFDSQLAVSLNESLRPRYKAMLTCEATPAARLIDELSSSSLFDGQPMFEIPTEVLAEATVDTIGINAQAGAPEVKIYLENDFDDGLVSSLLDTYAPHWSNNNLQTFQSLASEIGYQSKLLVLPVFGDAPRRVYFMNEQPACVATICSHLSGSFFSDRASSVCAKLEEAGCSPYVLRLSDNGQAVSSRVYMEQILGDVY